MIKSKQLLTGFRRVGLLGFPEDRNSSFLRGPALAPPLIRAAFASPAFNTSDESGNDVNEWLTDFGGVPTTECSDHKSLFLSVEPLIANIVAQHHSPLILGGDHSITYSIVKSLHQIYRSKISIVHFDAHPDIYHSFEGSPHSHACQFARLFEEDIVESMVSIGVRTACRHQRDQMQRFNVKAIEAKDFVSHEKNLHSSLSRLLQTPPSSSSSFPVYISFDMDVIEPGLAPGVSHREAGGLTPRQCLQAIHAIPGNIVGADIVEFNPTRDPTGLTADVAGKLMKELASKIMRCYGAHLQQP